MTILREQVLAITDRQAEYKEAELYYEGYVPEIFGSARLAQQLKTSYNSRLNFCRPVVDAVLNRLEIGNIQGSTQAATDKIGEIFENNQLYLDANEIHRKALEFGDCYAMVWPDENGELEISYNSPRGMALVYDPESPRKKLYAVKMWLHDKSNTRLNIYYSDRIEKYTVQSGSPTEGTNWNLIDTVPNEFGEVPVFHFRTHRPFGRPEHADMFDAQDYINKQFVQSMITSDYQGAPQRYALSEQGASSEVDDFNEGDTERENVSALKNGPGELWFLNGIKTVGQFTPADPDVFWKPITNTVRAGASLTNTPLHYFEKTGNVPSGEALRTAEAPLVKKVRNRAASFGQTWRELFQFALKVEGITADVEVKWAEVESMDESERWNIALKKRNAGVSAAQVLREAGYDEELIPQILEEAAEERAAGLVAGYERDTRVSTEDNETNPVKEDVSL